MEKRMCAVFAAALGLLLSSCASELLESAGLKEQPASRGQTGFIEMSLGDVEKAVVKSDSEKSARFLDASEIKKATVNVYYGKSSCISEENVQVSSGKGTVKIENIPVGFNRVIEVVGFKSNSVEGKRIYLSANIVSGKNTISEIKDGAASAKGKAYLALMTAGFDLNSADFSLSDSKFIENKSSSCFDADAFASAYMSDSSVSPADFYTAQGSVNFTNLVNASGYTVYLDDPLSEKLSVSSDSEKSAQITDVASGTWTVYVNNGTETKSVGKVTVKGGEATDFTDAIGNALKGKLIIFVKASSAPTLWAWEKNDGTALSEKLDGNWENQKIMDSATSEYMNNPEGWFMRDFSSAGSLKGTGTISFKLNKSAPEYDSGKTATFWYDGTDFYDSDPTTKSDDNGSGSGTGGDDDVIDDVSLSSVKVNGSVASISGTSVTFRKTGTDDSFAVTSVEATPKDSSASVTYSATSGTVLAGNSETFTITVTNGAKTEIYTLTVSYTKKSDAGGTESEYYWTNKNGYGTNKTISGLSSWSEDDKIIQGVACDTPRCWLGGHEYPDPDLYAMFAAYDDTNLYLLIEIPNVDDADAVDNDKCYAGSQFLPMGIVMNTGKRTAGNGTLDTGSSVWQGSVLYTWESGIDTMLMFHPRIGIGEPSIFKTQSDGTFTYESSVKVASEKQYCIGFTRAGVEREIYFNECVSENMWAAVVDEKGNWGGKSSTDMTSYDYVDYIAAGKKMSAYQVTIPLAALDIDKSYIENTGISVGCFSTYGASTMDCLPWDSCMIDNASESYSSDPSSSKEKEDVDNITAELARIGHK